MRLHPATHGEVNNGGKFKLYLCEQSCSFYSTITEMCLIECKILSLALLISLSDEVTVNGKLTVLKIIFLNNPDIVVTCLKIIMLTGFSRLRTC